MLNKLIRMRDMMQHGQFGPVGYEISRLITELQPEVTVLEAQPAPEQEVKDTVKESRPEEAGSTSNNKEDVV